MNAYTLAKERYAALGVDTEAVLETLKNVTVSVHCWQGDDVVGFDAKEALSGGIQTTGNYPGKATTPEQLMADFDEVLRLTPGKKKLNLHASYAIFEAGEFADRDAIQPKHFSRWVAYAKERGLGIDFNPTFFSHSMVKDGLTLSSPDETVRHFWVEHGKRCMAIAEYFAEETGKPAGAMVLPDGRVVTGKTSSLLGASASLLLNALKAQGGVSDKLDLISAQVIEPISKLKIESLGHHNPRLHSDEVLIALCISALTNPIAQLAQEQLGSLRGCDAHFSVIISEEDIKLYKRLGIHVSCEPKYESKRLYHK